MKKLLFLSFFLLLPIIGHAKKVRYYRFYHTVKKRDSFANILKKFVRDDSVINAKTRMVRKTVKENPHIKNWANLPPGVRVRVYVSSAFVDINKMRKYRKSLADKIVANMETLKEKGEMVVSDKTDGFWPKEMRASLFYMGSYGIFKQSNPDQAEITFLQNSPVSLGTAFSYYPEGSNWSYAWSFYFSYLLASGNNLDDSSVSIPPELGANFYMEKRIKKWKSTGYFGLDVERFSSFNLGGIQTTNKIYIDKTKVLYFTAGLSKVFKPFGHKVFNKLSLSKSILSTTTPAPEGSALNGDYSGFKFLWYLNTRISKKIFIHTLFKYHKMSGPSELSSLRLGFGFGYNLF